MSLASQCSVEKLPAKKGAGVRENEQYCAELAPLRLMNRQSVGKLQGGVAFLFEVLVLKSIGEAGLRRELDFQLPGWLTILVPELANCDANLAICDVVASAVVR